MAKAGNENGRDENAAAVEQVVAAKTKRKKIIMLALMAIVLIGISVGATLLMVNMFGNQGATNQEATASSNEVPGQDSAKKPAIYYPMQPVFVVNFMTGGRQRFMQLEINLMLRDQDIIPALELHMPAIRHNLVMLFSGQIYEDLQTAEGKELLRLEATRNVQKTLEGEIGQPGIEQVLFTNFVMQ
jgi:flagellar FliL protein